MPPVEEALVTQTAKFRFAEFDIKREPWFYYLKRFETELHLANFLADEQAVVDA